ncbi:uncharacterized protein BO66DRAFT_74078 [Aspergillus aculeatinus CBS 121060]|uniref:Uncharacterized protein n=1 Tax=Aspergillus aculeatinus CBS 121060 TaxID=1448322 RepID=A0ACD1HB86_9EURO|nr:hypothetical protein BO66DRAFT_74078 [Aspergillus aculeatinus CBS 121060]RAH70890.1 hypothetical protein BO66DRAFT_74078 [Aspergillus aculeatinus CBS 121060]
MPPPGPRAAGFGLGLDVPSVWGKGHGLTRGDLRSCMCCCPPPLAPYGARILILCISVDDDSILWVEGVDTFTRTLSAE